MATLEARMKSWPAIPSSMCLLFFVVTVAVVSNPVVVNAGSPPTYLKVYDHENNVPPNNTAVTSVMTGSSALSFGSITVLANILRETISNDSPVLGRIDGQVTTELGSLYLSVALVFNTPSYAGSVTIQGSWDLTGSGELAITGGTGDFRFARGYSELRATDRTELTDPSDIVYEFTLYIKYD